MRRITVAIVAAAAMLPLLHSPPNHEPASAASHAADLHPRLSPSPEGEVFVGELHDDAHDHYESLDAVQSQATGTVRTLVINVAHPGGPTLSRDAVAASSNSAAAILNALSRGVLAIEPTFFPVDVTVAGVADPCTQYATISDQALAIVRTQTTVADYRLLTYFFGGPGGGTCPGWAGRGQRPGSTTWNLITNDIVVAHEWGHNLGLDHLRAIRCTLNGIPVPFTRRADRGACETQEYGGAFSLMGGANSAVLTFAERSQLGWMRPGEEKGVTSGVHSLGADGPTSLLWMQNAEGDLFTLEFVRALPPDPNGFFFDTWERRYFPLGEAPDWTHSGVMIRHVTSFRSSFGTGSGYVHSSSVLDLNPQTLRATDAAMRAGQSFTDPTGSLIVEVLETLGDTATVRVSGAPIAVAAPSQGTATFAGRRRLNVSVQVAPTTPEDTRFVVQISPTRVFRKALTVTLNAPSGVVQLPASMARTKNLFVRVGALAPGGSPVYGTAFLASR